MPTTDDVLQAEVFRGRKSSHAVAGTTFSERLTPLFAYHFYGWVANNHDIFHASGGGGGGMGWAGGLQPPMRGWDGSMKKETKYE